MPEFDWSILLQIPIVAAFIWYSIAMQKNFQDSMAKRDEAYLNALDRISDDLKDNTKTMGDVLDHVTRK